MCGICGFAPRDPEAPVDPGLLARMADLLLHRGPDEGSLHLAPGVGLGVRRLSIIDPEGGHQPLSNEDATVTLVCNGEIYNAPELRLRLEAEGHRFRTGSDAEAIVHLYESQGADLVRSLRGMFAFALWDARRRLLLLARDRLGIKPLHYAITPEGLWFASEYKSLLVPGGVLPRLDPQAVAELFAFGWVLTPRTLAEGVRRLPPGHTLAWKRETATLRPYWSPSFPESGAFPRRSPQEWAEALAAKLDETVRVHLRSDVPVGVLLSPGLDSNAVATLAARASAGPLHSFTLAFEDGRCDETAQGRTLAQCGGYALRDERAVFRGSDFDSLAARAVWHAEDISLSAVEVPRMVLARLAGARVKTVLTGEGADEVFGGYRWYHGQRFLGPLAHVPWPLRHLAAGALARLRPGAARLLAATPRMDLARFQAMVGPPRWEVGRELLTSEFADRLDGVPKRRPTPQGFPRWHPFTQLQYHDLVVRLPDFIERDLDRCTMAFSVEARVPFLDHELVELCAQIPPAVKMRGWREKDVLRRAMKGVLPDDIRLRAKRGLEGPLDEWLRGPLPAWASDLLEDGPLAAAGCFRPQGVRRALAAHRAGARLGRQLFGVLGVQLWQELFVRRRHGLWLA
ncbi:MAG: asparagine synthase (glutamine-hydrolyzing) [Deltaproteobacteria bacterium]|nr:asparagine synthase (glutamine-hydrolyzing) [Deltaproteobacteria bacterium]